jgi:drug/metabolite transporter (DMT)-like permease
MSRYLRYTLLRYFKDYYYIESSVLNVIAAEFFVQIINVAFLSIQLIYMQKAGYSDHASAGFIACRFLGVLILAIPLGIYIRGKKILPLFYVAGLVVPSAAVLIIVATDYHLDVLLYAAQLLWGMGFTFIQTPVLPYILRNCEKRTQTGAIALSYSTYSFGGIISGVFVYILYAINPILFSERNLLLALSLISFAGIYFLQKAKTTENVPQEPIHQKKRWSDYDWNIIVRGLIPTLIIAVGAGLTIPFIGIFFFNVHHVSTGSFSLLNGIASILVAVSAMLVPFIKKSIGYKIAIPATQSFAVLALVLLATTQFYAHLGIALYIAILCFMLRQPLMNMAGPMTSELVMKYTGRRNQEMVSALTAAIWSGSWFISSLIFKLLRSSSWSYVYIFLITAFLYGIGVVWYYYLILDYNKRQKQGLITEGD